MSKMFFKFSEENNAFIIEETCRFQTTHHSSLKLAYCCYLSMFDPEATWFRIWTTHYPLRSQCFIALRQHCLPYFIHTIFSWCQSHHPTLNLLHKTSLTLDKVQCISPPTFSLIMTYTTFVYSLAIVTHTLCYEAGRACFPVMVDNSEGMVLLVQLTLSSLCYPNSSTVSTITFDVHG